MKHGRIPILLAINKMIIGGAEQQFLELVKGLDKTIFSPIVVTLHPGGALEPVLKKIPDIEYICLNRKGKWDFSTLWDFYKILKKYSVTIVQPFLTPVTFFLIIPAIIRRIPVRIITERGNSRTNLGFGHSIYLKIEDFLSRFVDRVIPNSKSGADYVVSRGIKPDLIKVIYNGINPDRLIPSTTEVEQIRTSIKGPADGIIIGISASLIPLKDHATFLRAAQIISRKIPRARFAILGDGPLREELETMAHDLGIDDVVSFLGNQVEVASYLDAFDLVCLCSAQPEGCSNAILESMMLGKTLIVTNAGGNSELVQNGINGLVVPIQDPPALADAIIHVIENPSLAQQMANNCQVIAKDKFTLERMVREYEQLYLDTLRQKNIHSHVLLPRDTIS